MKITAIANNESGGVVRTKMNTALQSVAFGEFENGVVINDNTFATASSVTLATSQSIKDYVDSVSGVIAGTVYVQTESDFPADISGVITLVSGYLYVISGNVVVTASIDVNGAILVGRDRTVDKITSVQTSSTLFVGDSSMIAQNLTFSITGVGSQLFNLSGYTGYEYVYLQDCTLASNKSLGTIDNHYAVQFINVPNQLSAAGLVLNDVLNISLRGFDTAAGHTSTTTLTFTGTSSLVQMYYCAFGVGVAQTALNISALTVSTYFEMSAGSGFSGVGTYITGTIGNNYIIDARNYTVIKDDTAKGDCYISASAATDLTITNPRKIAGTTTLSANVLRMDANSTDNRLRYLGTKTRIFQVSAFISFTSAANNKVYEFTIYKNGSVVTGSAQDTKIGTGADTQAVSVSTLVSLATNDYVEVWVQGITDTTLPTITQMNLIAI